MKRFEFTLSKLLNYKEQILRKEKNELADLRGQQQAAIDKCNETVLEMQRRNHEFVVKTGRGMNSYELISEKRYLALLVNQIRIYENTIHLFEEKIEKQLYVVVEANKEVSSLENLKEKQLEDYKKEVQKSEELFIDEYVTNSSFYKN